MTVLTRRMGEDECDGTGAGGIGGRTWSAVPRGGGRLPAAGASAAAAPGVQPVGGAAPAAGPRPLERAARCARAAAPRPGTGRGGGGGAHLAAGGRSLPGPTVPACLPP